MKFIAFSARAPRHTRGQEKRKQVGRRPRVHQKEHGPYGRSRGGSRHVVHRSSGQGVFRVFRFQDALLSFQRSGGRVRVPGHQFFLYPRQRDCREVREHTAVGYRGCVYNLHRLDAHRERHGASDLPAARVLCPKHDRVPEMDCADLHTPEHRGESRRYADPVREPAEPLPLHEIQHTDRGSSCR